MVGSSAFEDGSDPASVADRVSGEIEDDGCAQLQQVDRQGRYDASNFLGSREILLKVLDRLSESEHPLVFTEQDRRR
jgi:hypothetical protein